MGFNFVGCDRDQLMLMPPSVADWLPEDHLAWFIVDVVDELDLSAFLSSYRSDGRGGSAYPPAMMVALLVYAYSVGERSSRSIERRCVEDVAFRVLAANLAPDHATIARFRATHEKALAELFGQVLALCSRAGVLRPGLVAVDGTKLAANASRDATAPPSNSLLRSWPRPQRSMPARTRPRPSPLRVTCLERCLVGERLGASGCGSCSQNWRPMPP